MSQMYSNVFVSQIANTAKVQFTIFRLNTGLSPVSSIFIITVLEHEQDRNTKHSKQMVLLNRRIFDLSASNSEL